ncbi:MAG: hypothetical protein L0Z50_07215 [Verrucomicrobiales bacterium]|nr:hypothetical protein [Verrucomicrobiales bacterium]
MPKSHLTRHWVHSHEEDTPTEMIFRPVEFKFPPSRGRASFELLADGTLIDHGIGAGDAVTETRGTWRESPDGELILSHGATKKPARLLKIVSARRDRLVVRK